MAVSEIGAKEVGKTDNCSEKVKVHLVLVVVFNNIKERNGSFVPLGSSADYKNVINRARSETGADRKFIAKTIYLSEYDEKEIQRFRFKWQGIFDSYINNALIEDIEISIFSPASNSYSLSSIFVNHLFFGNRIMSADIFSALTDLVTKPFDLTYSKIKVNNIIPLFLTSANDFDAKSTQVEINIPDDKDAQVAAILCEYAYYYLNKMEYDDCSTNDGVPIVGFIQDRIKRYGSIYTRYESSKNELKIVRHYLNLERYSAAVIYPGNSLLTELFDTLPFSELYSASTIYSNNSLLTEFIDTLPFPINKLTDFLLAIVNSPDSRDKKIEETIELSTVNEKVKNWKVIHTLAEENKDIIPLIFKVPYISIEFTQNDSSTGFSSVLYANLEEKKCIFCTKGSDFGWDILTNHDWLGTNILQGLCGMSDQYTQSSLLASMLDNIVRDDWQLFFTGHSLGGGLASNNALVTKYRHAITFNAAGLNWNRIRNLETLSQNPRKRVHPFIIQGEVLNNCLKYLGQAAYGSSYAEVKSGTASNIIEPEDGSLGCSERHSMVNFLTSKSQLGKIKVNPLKVDSYQEDQYSALFKDMKLQFNAGLHGSIQQ
ncbi:MAG: hypothetical protein IAC23_08130 [Bacteroidetes bacterium]|uniref:Fungal lipase-like domain-containing protein n=1 Tax=Candidatus Cryptobacteroides merdavium TaxID=2840769 RepID=A0A9D9EFY8_9BACT|nr:hypothetical protein [Candidatus Cryptobacteroides merdavium]